MSDLERIKAAANASWMMFKKYTGTDCTDAKWDAIITEAGRICKEANDDSVVKQIVFGFVGALEMEERKLRHGTENL